MSREHQFERLATIIGHPEWIEDERFATRDGWVTHREEVLRPAIEKWTSRLPKLEIAELVDNGNVVPITVSVSSPMTAANHVKAIAVFNEKNPQRETVKFELGPRYGKSEVSTRIRLATTQKLVAVAHLSDGTFWSHTVEVIVTIAACIEGED